jgi:hypothetical protein
MKKLPRAFPPSQEERVAAAKHYGQRNCSRIRLNLRLRLRAAMHMQKNPRVFVSHAGEDKHRFVLKFAQRLWENGIEAWLDQWEMTLGDSLVDKIFEEGIGNADAFIVAISKNSAEKPWVREELNAAVVSRITKGTRLIPVILDDCEVPEAVKSTVWIRIKNLQSYDTEFKRIISAIYGHSEKPSLGERPSYTLAPLPFIHDLTRSDMITLNQFGRQAIDSGSMLSIPTESVWRVVEVLHLSREEFLDSCQVLSSKRYLEKSPILSPTPRYYGVTDTGMDRYLTAFRAEDYKETLKRIGFAVANEGMSYNKDMASKLQAPRVIVDHVLRMFELKGFLRVRRALGGHVRIKEVLPGLKRWLESL